MKNSFLKKKPSRAKYWDSTKNNIQPSEISYGSNKKFWFKCENNHSFQESPKIMTYRQQICNECSFQSNRLDITYPELIEEWDKTKNITSPAMHTYGEHTEVSWICSVGHSWKVAIKERTIGNYGCPYCGRTKLSPEFSLKNKNPKISKEWDYKKNKDKPEDIFSTTHSKRWWICEKGHSYQARVSHRVKAKSSCTYCMGGGRYKKVSSESSLTTINPAAAKMWDYKKNKDTPEEVLATSHSKRWWICENGHSFNQPISFRLNRGCANCELKNKSKEEIYLLFELKKFFKIDPNDNKINLKDKIYDVDIKIPDHKIVVEYDGSYWHKDKVDKDKFKTQRLQKEGWIVIRVREKPLKILSRTYNVSSIPMDYKNTSNKVLKKIVNLGINLENLNVYTDRKILINKKNADLFIKKLINEN